MCCVMEEKDKEENMSKVLIGIVTFGNYQFTKLTVESIRNTSNHPVDFFIVVGKPGDSETLDWLATEPEIRFVVHTENWGFPKSVNDIYDYAWKDNDYDYLIIAGNDIVAYPDTIDTLINVADTTDYEVVSALQYDVKSLIKVFPETKKYFYGDACIFTDFTATPWNAFAAKEHQVRIADMQMHDIQNLCLYKKSVMKTVGYTDVNFYPAYYIDNDYARRIVNAGIRCCTVVSARFFHFWSRTIKQGSGGSTSKNFENNREYYVHKWGGDFAQETRQAPILIDSREHEEEIIRKWKSV